MNGVTFEHPEWLLAAPALWALAWWIARRSLSGFTSTRRSGHFLMRCALVALVCCVLAEPHLHRRADDVAVIAVVDVSDSVPAQQRGLTQQFLAASMGSRPPGDRFGLVTVADRALVQSLPGAGEPRLDMGYTGPGSASRLQAGIDLGRALIPGDAAGRVLLISDGNETSGSLAGAASRLLAAGIPIDVASVEYDRSALPQVEDVMTPAWVRDGDTIVARIVISAGAETTGRLTMLLNGEPLDLDPESPSLAAPVHLSAGRNVLSQQLKLPPGPVHRLEAFFQPDDSADALPELLRDAAVTFTSARGRVLLLAESEAAAAPFARAIADDNVEIQVAPAASAPTDLAGWAGYDAVVLFDQPASAFSQAQQADLARYVHDTGGGLLVIGGPNSYGAGGWIDSPLADALPVMLDPPQKRQLPMGALAIVLDRSGSMSGPVGGTGMSKQQAAIEAAILGVQALSRLDQVAVVAFSGGSEVIVPLTTRGEIDPIAGRIRSIGPGGGTNMFPAIDAAAAELASSGASVRHIVVLTDGETTGNPAYGVSRAAELARSGITLSTIAIGDSVNTPLLQQLAAAGGGRAHAVRSSDAGAVLPQIFITEVQTVRRSLIWEGTPFSPQRSATGETMRGISGELPAIGGYVVTADRGGLATVLLRGPESDPILAQWQYGLGRVAAWTTDATTRWVPEWTAWDAFGAFWLQQLKWTLRPGADSRARATLERQGDVTRVLLELTDDDGRPVNFAALQARVAPPDPTDQSAQDVQFRQVGPGQYEAKVPAEAIGAHVLSVGYEAPGPGAPRRGSFRAAIVRRAGDEFRQPAPDTALLWSLAQRTNGRIFELTPAGADVWTRHDLTMPVARRPLWLALAIIAVGLFLLDVAARRIAFDLARLPHWLGLMAARPAEAAPASLARLGAARERARAAAARPQPDASARHAPPEYRPRPPATSQYTAADEAPAPGAHAPDAGAIPNREAGAAESEGDVMARLRAAKRRSHGADADDEPEPPQSRP